MAEAQDSLTDGALQSEIELVGDLVVAASSSDGPLPQTEIDRLLGVEGESEGQAADQGEATDEATLGDDVGTADEVKAETIAAERAESAEENDPRG